MAEILSEKGFKNVHPLHGGFKAWQEGEGYPLEEKERDRSEELKSESKPRA